MTLRPTTAAQRDALGKRAAAEFVGAALLVATVVGSGVMAEELAMGNGAIALLANTLATGAGLFALIATFGPISGAHFNPVVTLAATATREFRWRDAPAYCGSQVAGAVAGTLLAHAMFAMPWITLSQRERHGFAQLLSELVATFGLIAVIASCGRRTPARAPLAIAAYITAAYWFTASTSFANPAVTIARSLSDTFAGIRPADVPGFLLAQAAGATLAAALFRWLVPPAEGSAGEVA